MLKSLKSKLLGPNPTSLPQCGIAVAPLSRKPHWPKGNACGCMAARGDDLSMLERMIVWLSKKSSERSVDEVDYASQSMQFGFLSNSAKGREGRRMSEDQPVIE